MVDQRDIDSSETVFTIRSVFIIDPAKKIRLTMMYPASVGRNTGEVLRVLDSLQTGDKKGVTTPIDWQVRMRRKPMSQLFKTCADLRYLGW